MTVKHFSIGFLVLGVVGTFALGCSSGSDSVAGSSEGAATGTLVGEVTQEALTPDYWNVDANPTSPTPGSEPINVIISTNMDLADPRDPHAPSLLDDLWRVTAPDGVTKVDWASVDIGAGLEFVTGLAKGETRCISAEKASIDGDGKGGDGGRVTDGCFPETPDDCLGAAAEDISLRTTPNIALACGGVLFDGESHARAWKSNKTRVRTSDGKPLTTWYLALSQEHVCTVNVNGKDTPWHCILPNGFEGKLPGMGLKKISAPKGGYNQGRDEFVADLKRIATVRTYEIICKDFERPEGQGLRVPDVDPVTWDNKVTHCSIIDRTQK